MNPEKNFCSGGSCAEVELLEVEQLGEYVSVTNNSDLERADGGAGPKAYDGAYIIPAEAWNSHVAKVQATDGTPSPENIALATSILDQAANGAFDTGRQEWVGQKASRQHDVDGHFTPAEQAGLYAAMHEGLLGNLALRKPVVADSDVYSQA